MDSSELNKLLWSLAMSDGFHMFTITEIMNEFDTLSARIKAFEEDEAWSYTSGSRRYQTRGNNNG